MAEEQKQEATPSEAKKPTTKQIWAWVGIGLDVAVTIFLLIVSIILISNSNNATALKSATGFMGMIGFFLDQTRNGPTVFLWCIVVPLFVLLVVNIVLTVSYYQKEAAKEKAEAEKAKAAKAPSLDNLSDAQKEALRAELLKEMKGEQKEEAKPEAKPEEKK